MAFQLFFIMLVSYTGIVIGYLLGRIASEERKPLKDAVHILQHLSAFFTFVVAFIGAYFNKHFILMATFLAFAMVIVYIHATAKSVLIPYRLALSSIALGVFMMFSAGPITLFAASGVFVFFTCLGILETTSKLSSLGKLALCTCWFLAVAVLTLF